MNLFIRLSLVMILLIPVRALASELVLKSGQKLEGTIVEKTDEYIRIDPNIGVVVTYYTEEIDTVNGQRLQNLVSPAAAPVAAPIAQVTDKALAIIITNAKMAGGIDKNSCLSG
jgi:hypothetical protein